MGRYSMDPKREERPWKIHPVWRGIGIIWLILVPILSYALAKIFTPINAQHGWLPVSAALAKQIIFTPYTLPSGVTLDPNVIVNIFPWGPHYYIELLYWGAFAFLGFGIMSVIYAFLYKLFGPPPSPYSKVKDPPRRQRR